ncbi:portal protein [bacterium]|nr:portal protein [bacterium]
MADTSPTNDGRASTFGRNLVSYISNRLPYTNQQDDQLNTKYKYFAKNGTQRAEALAKASVTSSNPYNNIPIGDFGKDGSFQDVMYASLDTNKSGRVRDYRTIAAYSEVSDALDEICDECINVDENGRVAKVNYENIDLTVDNKKELDAEFDKYIDYFDLRSKGWQYFRQLMVEGEVFFELILHENYTNEGVLGLMNIPAEVVDPVYNNVQNMLVKGYIYKKPIFSVTQPDKIEKTELIPMEQNQLVYANSGVYNETKDFVIPFLENARRPYRQLSLIEDAIVIYRLVRAPERLVFNVDVGNMAPPKAEAYLRKLIQNYWSKKTFDNDQGGVVNKFNPQSMLDAFWFAKRQGSEGTSVTQLPGGANLGELADLMYFIKKLYRALKVPATRIDPEDRTVDSASILREELKFAKFIIRQQQRFATAIKRGFITHLKLRGLWAELELGETNIEIIFNTPSNYFEMREAQKLELKAANFSSLASNEFISVTYAQKKYLGWKDRDILANREFLRKDAEMQWELSQIQAAGPMWKEQLAVSAAGAESEIGGEGGGVGGGDGGIPDFGGGPAGEVGDETGDAGAEEFDAAADIDAGAEADA